MDLNLTNSQTPIVVSSNTTALNDRNYTVVANATFTDPTPVEGKGFKVFVRNGTAVIGGTSYTVGSEIIRIFHSGSWANYRLDATDKVTSNAPIIGATKTKITYDSKGLVTAGADLTASELFAILGLYQYQINTASSLVTTTSPTIVGNIPIPANTYNSSGGKFEFNMFCVKTAAVGTITIEAWLGQTSNNLAGATRIATTGAVTLNARYAPFRRKTNFDGTNIVGLSFSSGNQNDDSSNSTSIGSLAFDRTIDNYLMFVITLASASDNAYLQFAEFKNF